MYVLNLKTKMIHSKEEAKPLCQLKNIPSEQKAEVPGLNWDAVDNQGWRFCKSCFEREPRRS